MASTPRTTATAVEEVLGNDFGLKADGTPPSLIPYMQGATVLVTRMLNNAIAKGFTHTVEELELIERYLAAHFYTKMDPTYSSRSTQGASASFIRGKDKPEPYKDIATGMDGSGCLIALLNRNRATLTWLGKPVSVQIPYEQRD